MSLPALFRNGSSKNGHNGHHLGVNGKTISRPQGSVRTGVVLAAGFGSRLAGISEATDLKPLTPVAGKPLILRTLESLEQAGCTRAVIVLGYCSETHRTAIEELYRGPLTLHFVVNERYDLKNGVSVLAAAPYVRGDFVLMMADHVVGREVMKLAHRHMPPSQGATLLVDYKLGTIFDMEDATKVYAEAGRVRAIGKEILDYNCIDTGVFVCTAGLLEALQTVLDATGDASLSDGVQYLARQGRMQTLDIGDGFWQDVDTPEMLAHAERILGETEAPYELPPQIVPEVPNEA